MASLTTLPVHQGWGSTSRRDAWWLGPLLTVLGLSAFLIYGFIRAWMGNGYEVRYVRGSAAFHEPGNSAVRPYLSPFFSPLIYDPAEDSHHAWMKGVDLRLKLGLPDWVPFSAGFLILAFPGIFRLTCYYYRKAYYRAFWQDPPACAVGEPRKSYWGENHWPLLLQNIHRYTLYFALLFLIFLSWDAIQAFIFWPRLDATGKPVGSYEFGVGVGSFIMVANVVLLSCFTFGCNSLRHLVGGRMNCFSCPDNPERVTTSYKAWKCVSWFNGRHAMWAWLSLFMVGFTDFYIWMVALGIWHDYRII
jgi:hypothetical protein